MQRGKLGTPQETTAGWLFFASAQSYSIASLIGTDNIVHLWVLTLSLSYTHTHLCMAVSVTHTHIRTQNVFLLRTWLREVKSNFPSCSVRREMDDNIGGLSQHDFLHHKTLITIPTFSLRAILICKQVSTDHHILFSVMIADVMCRSTSMCLLLFIQSRVYSEHWAVITFHSDHRLCMFSYILNHLFCFPSGVSVSISTFSLVAIAIERYSAICNPLKSRVWQTRSHAYRVIAATWVLAFTIMIPYPIISHLESFQRPDNTTAHQCRHKWPLATAEQTWWVFEHCA